MDSRTYLVGLSGQGTAANIPLRGTNSIQNFRPVTTSSARVISYRLLARNGLFGYWERFGRLEGTKRKDSRAIDGWHVTPAR